MGHYSTYISESEGWMKISDEKVKAVVKKCCKVFIMFINIELMCALHRSLICPSGRLNDVQRYIVFYEAMVYLGCMSNYCYGLNM